MTSQIVARNRWRSFPDTGPLMVWTMVAPSSSTHETRQLVDAVLRAGRETGVLIAAAGAVVADGEPLPWEAVVKAGGIAPFTSRVFVRDGNGNIIEQESNNAGQLLARIERLHSDDVRRIAAPRPFAVAWTTSKLSTITFSFAFFTTLWIEVSDAELLARNGQRLEKFRTALSALARAQSARLTAAMPAK
jgi:hypothetical protein